MEKEKLQKHIENLKEYCSIDKKIIDNFNDDFSDFCRNHVADIEAVIEAYENLERKTNESKM